MRTKTVEYDDYEFAEASISELFKLQYSDLEIFIEFTDNVE